jgi:hypothetical protein
MFRPEGSSSGDRPSKHQHGRPTGADSSKSTITTRRAESNHEHPKTQDWEYELQPT